MYTTAANNSNSYLIVKHQAVVILGAKQYHRGLIAIPHDGQNINAMRIHHPQIIPPI